MDPRRPVDVLSNARRPRYRAHPRARASARHDCPVRAYGDITENQFTQIVDVHGGRPEPITIRYVYKLNKPINEILEELRREAGVEEGEAFGKDFIFSAWITDKTKDALITNT
ncbi:hypothetical protein GMD01_11355 [[Ruminococcus] torques]|uniref:hypothetical protein n=1 Tax=[Ruminococcus] torques TaxID=33039 RepID=UPI0012BC2685|nr:hypothetical protein [[Ruminococcus] torques]MTQ74260.1 hypothetical protein [[Ruminococcus] torques]MTQ78655.1 hypothetical protein [[Ruminococcus] torques]MTQ85040.1 hypothetical protein [[Ruminococcus] torques]MTR59371.1 hypothetical protein [[Ruminococcus] torques]MTS75798.1 hypothetical protein [[Ruminococcus] torques]